MQSFRYYFTTWKNRWWRLTRRKIRPWFEFDKSIVPGVQGIYVIKAVAFARILEQEFFIPNKLRNRIVYDRPYVYCYRNEIVFQFARLTICDQTIQRLNERWQRPVSIEHLPHTTVIHAQRFRESVLTNAANP